MSERPLLSSLSGAELVAVSSAVAAPASPSPPVPPSMTDDILRNDGKLHE
ncbi:hypothetical protein [Streptomyces globisporus]